MVNATGLPSTGRDTNTGRTGVWWLVATVILCAPLLRGRYFLTQDGPTHLHNARILVDRLTGNWTPYADFYELNLALEPNWFTHAFLTGALLVVPPWVAEKALLIAYLLIFAFGFYRLARAVGGSPMVALLAVPFAFNVPFQMGFFNFSFSVAFLPWIVAWWWRQVGTWSIGKTVGLSASLLLLYFCHPVGLVFAGLTLVIACLLREAVPKSHIVQLFIAGLPSMILLALFVGRHGGAEPGGELPFGALLLMLLGNSQLVLLQNRELFIGASLAFVVIAAVVGGIVRMRQRAGQDQTNDDRRAAALAFLAVAFIALLLFFVMPDRVGSGLYLRFRLQLLIWLFAVMALCSMPWGRRGERLLATLALAAALGFTIDRWSGYGTIADDLDRYLSISETLPDGAVVLPLSFDHSGRLDKAPWSSAYVHHMVHAAHYMGTDRPLVFLDNYEAGQGYFPIRWRPDIDPLEWMPELALEPPCISVETYEANTSVSIENVVVWGLAEEREVGPCGRALLDELASRDPSSDFDGWIRMFAAPTSAR